jgi:hypothetical protein
VGYRVLAILLGLLVGTPTAAGQACDREEAIGDFRDHVRLLVDPDAWEVYGGGWARIDFVDDAIVLEATGGVPEAPHHAQVAALIRHLRVEATVRAATSPAP